MKRWPSWKTNALLCVAVIAWVGVPLLWVAVCSVKQQVDQYRVAVVPWRDFDPTMAQWRERLKDPALLRALSDSVVVATLSTAVALFLGVPAGYGLARFRFRRWSNLDILLFMLSQRVLPPIVTIIPLYYLFRTVGLFDTVAGLTIAHATFNLPFVVLITRNGFADLPGALEEAALVDGCPVWRLFFTIALPLAAPAIAVAGLIAFSFSWNEFLFALILTNRDVLTLPRFIQGAAENTWGIQLDAVAVLGLVAVIPPAVLALLAQRFLVGGLTAGGDR